MTIKVGDVYRSENYGDFEIVEYTNSKIIKIKFINTGSFKLTSGVQVVSGKVRDDTAPRLKGVKIGDKFQTNNSGLCEVVEYKHSKRILVRFEDGTLKYTNSSQLNLGTASSRKEVEDLIIGNVYHTKSGNVVVKELLKKSRCLVEFEDGETKIVSITSVKNGNVYKGTWNYSAKELVEKMTDIHNGRYSYDESTFVNVKTKMRMFCKEHGEFWCDPSNHISSSKDSPTGCRKCSFVERAKKRTLSSDLFLKEAINLNGNRYEYFLEDYTTREQKIRMKCTHCESIFLQSPEKHLYGRNCPACSEYGFKPHREGSFYILETDGLTKIGVTNNTAEHRTREINSSSGLSFKVVSEYRMDGVKCLLLERKFLELFRKDFKNPIDKFDGYTECFYNLKAEDVKEMVECII